jgi:aspartate/methionine/tyrosine aminotransferase
LASGPIGYTQSLGLPSLRARIARHYAERHSVDIDPSRIVITTGSSAAFLLAFLAMLEQGDRVAVANPGYPPYSNVLSALGCEAVPIEISATRFAIAPEDLIAAHRERPLKAVLVASPANPTGTMMTEDALGALRRAAAAEGIAFISDEIYHGLDYAFAAQTALAISNDAVVINSFSKYFCMTGWRVGWMVVPDVLVRPIERLQQNLAISVPTLSQIAAEAAFEGSAEMEAVKRGYEASRRVLTERLSRAGLASFPPMDGAF